MQRDNKIRKLETLAANQLPLTLFKANDVMMCESLAPRFLQYVINADWAMVEAMLAKNPLLMFEMVEAEDVSDPRLPAGSRVSGLGYACIMRDKYTRNICKSAMASLEPKQREEYKQIVQSFPVEDNIPTHDATMAEDGYGVFMAMVQRWLANDADVSIHDLRTYLLDQTHQLSRQDQIYNLQPYYWSVEAFVVLYRSYRNPNNPFLHNPLVTKAKLDTFWQKIEGFAKKYLLPRHMLKQMHAQEQDDGRYRWAADAGFDEANYPTDCRVRDYRKRREGYFDILNIPFVYIDFESDANPDDIFGENYSFIRAGSHASADAHGDDYMSRRELEKFRHLDVVRRTDLIREQLDLGVDLAATKMQM